MKVGIRTLIVAAALLTAAVAAPAAAQAAPESASVVTAAPQNDDGDGHVFTAPGTPRISEPPADKVTATASSPTVSPTVGYQHVVPGGSYTCYSGYFCAGVWDPVYSKWKIFKFYYCDFHTLYNWLGNGFYLNNQTGGATAIFYGSGRQPIRYVSPDGRQYPYDWDPVYYIKNC